jgi:glycerophosphoryl diester phosphodiesterase
MALSPRFLPSRARIMVAATLCLVSALRGPAYAGPAPADSSPAVIAHRGGAMLRPENTLPAFRHAAEIGTDVLEFDMMMTADGRVVVHHDSAIIPDFCTPDTGSGVKPAPIHELTLAETQHFDCGSKVRPSYAGVKFVPVPGARIPTLDAMLAAFRDADVRFFAETKIPKGVDIDPVRFATLVEQAVRRNGLEDRLILQSFDFRTIDAMHRINPRIRTCLLGAQKLTSDYLTLLRQHNASCIVLDRTGVDADGIAKLRKAGVLVYSSVVDTADEWRAYADLGFDALFTNEPQGALDFLRAERP